VKRWLPVASALVLAAWGIVIWQSRTPIIMASFKMNDTQTEGLFAINMPVKGQACIVDDLNFRNESVATPVKDYWDIESRHRIVVLDTENDATLFVDVPTFVETASDEPVLAKSYCQPKDAGAPIALRIHRENDSAPWQLVMN
jgi:hypothetical protein